MQEWLDFYHDLLHFREIHEIDAHWHVGGIARDGVAMRRGADSGL